MSIAEEENKLFDEWRDGTPGMGFVPDGVVCPEEWEQMPVRIVFLLKESNGAVDDLRHFLLKGGRGMTWNNVTRWTYALRTLVIKKEMPRWEAVKRIYPGTRKYNLRKIAAINVKKQPGGASTNTQHLIASFRKYNRQYLGRQISLLGHIDYLVCCGDGVAQCYAACTHERLAWKRVSGHVRRAVTEDGTVVVDFFHPQCRQGIRQLFFQFCEAIK